ncbi:MAG: hypothetical protein ACLQVI_36015 [Polyangiaceae bacterium]|jgi:arginine/lysine/ornithine decarboxylase
MHYEELSPISQQDADEALSRDDDTYVLCQSLLRVALHEEDWAWALDHVSRFLLHPHPEVRGVAVASIGYLVRIHRAIDVSRVLPALYALQADSYVASRVRDTLEDIRQFAHAA